MSRTTTISYHAPLAFFILSLAVIFSFSNVSFVKAAEVPVDDFGDPGTLCQKLTVNAVPASECASAVAASYEEMRAQVGALDPVPPKFERYKVFMTILKGKVQKILKAVQSTEPAPTKPPVQTNPVSISRFSASASSITAGEKVTLKWTSNLIGTDRTYYGGGCSIEGMNEYNAATQVTKNLVAQTGSVTVAPKETTTYTVWCTSGAKDGSPTAEEEVTVMVTEKDVSTPITTSSIDLESDGSSAVLDVGDDMTSADDKGVFTIKFMVTALDADVYIKKTTYRGTPPGNKDHAEAANFAIEDGGGNVIYTGKATAAFASTAKFEKGFYKISEGETEDFTLRVTYAPQRAGFYALRLTSIEFYAQPSASGKIKGANWEDFTTEPLAISGTAGGDILGRYEVYAGSEKVSQGTTTRKDALINCKERGKLNHPTKGLSCYWEKVLIHEIDAEKPSCTITANKTKVSSGEELIISWTSQGLKNPHFMDHRKGGGKFPVEKAGSVDMTERTHSPYTMTFGMGSYDRDDQTYDLVCEIDVEFLGNNFTAENAKLVAVAAYKGVNEDKNGRTSIEVNVAKGSVPLVLSLSALRPVDWKIVNPHGRKIEKILLSGFHTQRVSGHGSTPVDSTSVREGDEYGYDASQSKTCYTFPLKGEANKLWGSCVKYYTNDLANYLKRETGLKISKLHRSFVASSFTVGGEAQFATAGEATLASAVIDTVPDALVELIIDVQMALSDLVAITPARGLYTLTATGGYGPGGADGNAGATGDSGGSGAGTGGGASSAGGGSNISLDITIDDTVPDDDDVDGSASSTSSSYKDNFGEPQVLCKRLTVNAVPAEACARAVQESYKELAVKLKERNIPNRFERYKVFMTILKGKIQTIMRPILKEEALERRKASTTPACRIVEPPRCAVGEWAQVKEVKKVPGCPNTHTFICVPATHPFSSSTSIMLPTPLAPASSTNPQVRAMQQQINDLWGVVNILLQKI